MTYYHFKIAKIETHIYCQNDVNLDNNNTYNNSDMFLMLSNGMEPTITYVVGGGITFVIERHNCL